MTATELLEALRGVPSEALCGTISFAEWPCKVWTDGKDREISPDHAAALQRDSMCEWISLHSGDDVWPVLMHLGGETYWSIDDDEHYPTRLHALAAACRYVAAHAAGQKGAEK